MKSIGQDVITVFSFDLFKLNSRLEKMENPDDKACMVAFTFLSDAARLFVVGCILALLV